MNPINLKHEVPPQIENGKLVVLSGRLPSWFVGSLSLSYRKTASAFAIYEPGIGAIVCWNKTSDYNIGDILKINALI